MKKDNSCQSCKKDLGEEYSYSWGNFTELCGSCYFSAFWDSVRQPANLAKLWEYGNLLRVVSGKKPVDSCK